MQKMLKRIFAIVVLIFLVLGTTDFIITRFGQKKYYKIQEKGATIKARLAKGILVYGDDHIYIYKWNISSIEEIKN